MGFRLRAGRHEKPRVSVGFENSQRDSLGFEILAGTRGFEVSGSVRVFVGKMVHMLPALGWV